MRENFLPVTREDMTARGWDQPDFIFVSGDAYVDHPSFGAPLLGRVLEAAGYKVAMLAQPDWHGLADIRRLGKPRLGFLVSSGVIDSMVNHYTAARKRRSEDAYTPGGIAGKRPDRALIIYCNLIHRAYPKVPILIGGVEASLRRFTHYDYWADAVRGSILRDTGATLLLYGMGERSIVACAHWLDKGADPAALPGMRGLCYMSREAPEGYLELPSHADCAKDRQVFAEAFALQYREQDPVRGKGLYQSQGDLALVQNPPDLPLTQWELDDVYALPFTRAWHPDYDADGGVPALEEVKFSIAATRGCFGGCSFCSITFLQGKQVSARSHDSVLAEAQRITALPDFKGYIHDVGGPTANFRAPACGKQKTKGACADRQCLYPEPCPNLRVDHREYTRLLQKLRALPGVKKVFVRSGLRYDYIMADKDPAFLRELCAHHISGQLKVAPEHIAPQVLAAMGKPGRDVYDAFVRRYRQINDHLGKAQYLVPYLMSSHPGSDLGAAIELAIYLRDNRLAPEQVQDFYPTPGTLSTCMFHTGLDPRNMRPLYVPRTPHEKALQRALLQYRRPQNRALVLEALRLAGREDLIGFGKECLVRPMGERFPGEQPKDGGQKPRTAKERQRASRSSFGDGSGHSPRGEGVGTARRKGSPRGKGKPGGKRKGK